MPAGSFSPMCATGAARELCGTKSKIVYKKNATNIPTVQAYDADEQYQYMSRTCRTGGKQVKRVILISLVGVFMALLVYSTVAPQARA